MIKTFSLHILIAVLCILVVAPLAGIILPGALAWLVGLGAYGVGSTAITSVRSEQKALTR